MIITSPCYFYIFIHSALTCITCPDRCSSIHDPQKQDHRILTCRSAHDKSKHMLLSFLVSIGVIVKA